MIDKFDKWVNENKKDWSKIAISVAYLTGVELNTRAQALAQTFLNDDKNKSELVEVLGNSHTLNKMCDALSKSGINEKTKIFQNSKKARRDLKETLGII